MFLKQLLRVMRITAILLLTIAMHVSGRGLSQAITYSGKNVSLREIFRVVETQTDFGVFYNYSWLDHARPVSIEAVNKPLVQFLKEAFIDQPLQFKIDGKTVIVSRREALPFVFEEDGTAAKPPIRGTIRDEDGNPIGNVSIMVKGINRGTTTDANGSFTIDLNPGDALIISCIGYETKEVLISSNKSVQTTLQRTQSQLDEMQIIAYGSTSKRLNTGAVSTVKSQTIERQPVSNVLSALSGQVPGLAITQSTGVPGANITVRIRGLNSLAGANEPLILIDGVPFSSNPLFGQATVTQAYGGASPLNAINPNDIERLEVLKDADATAIYGSRGANGVILITTKKGKSGKTGVDVNVYHGIGRTSRKMELLSRRQYLDMRYIAFENDGIDWRDPAVTANDLKVWDTTRYTDWQEELIGGTANYTNAQITLHGGTEMTNFSLSGNYWKETTVYPGNYSNQKYSGRFGLTHRSANDRFRVEFSSFYLFNDNRLPSFDFTWGAMSTSPVAPAAFLEDGSLNWSDGTFGDNPMAYRYQSFDTRSNNINASALFSYSIGNGLSLRTSAGFNKVDHEMINLLPLKSLNPFTPWGIESSGTYTTNSSNGWNLEPYIEYERLLGMGTLQVLAGATLQSSVGTSALMAGRNYIDDNLMRNPAAARTVFISPSVKTEYRYNAVFGRLNYNLDNKYLLNLTIRRDGSSRFGPGRQFGNFGAAGVAWIFSEEPFVKGALPFISYGKLRASYGITGSDGIGDYAYLPSYAPNYLTYAGSTPLYPERLYNANFGWETNKKADIQLDLGFFKDRILISANYYRNRSGNQLTGLPLPAITGFQSISGNLAATVQNTGWELMVNTINVKTRSFSWTSSLNITIPRNKLITYPGLENSTHANLLALGYSISLEKTYNYIRVNPQTGVNLFRSANGKDTSFITSTFFNQADRTALVELFQHFFGGLNNSIQFKGLALDFTFEFKKTTRSTDIPGLNGNVPGLPYNQAAYVFNHSWRNPGDIAEFQKFTQSTNSPVYRSRHTNSSSGRYEDVSFVRLNNVSLSYQLPPRWQKTLHAKNFRVYILGQNLLTITDFEGLDPEGGNTSLPRLRVLTAGFQLNF